MSLFKFSMADFFSKHLLRLVIFMISLTINLSAQQEPSKIPQMRKADAPTVAYRLHQGDKLSVKFLYHAELNEISLTVRPDGFINLQLIEDIQAEGLTIAELKKQLEKKYDEILINPVISVALLEFVAPRVFVGGQVGKPGSYDLRSGQTLVEMIFLAGGFTAAADRRNVLYARRDENGKWQIQSANILNILKQKKNQEDVALGDGDYVFVPDSKLSRFNKAVETFSGLLPRVF